MTFTPQFHSYTYNNEVRDALVSVRFNGVQEAIQAFEGAIAELKSALAQGLYSEAEVVMTDAKANYVPVGQPPDDKAPGTLRNSGFVNEPEWSGDQVTINLGFGGAAEEYALRQHEELSYKHTVGQAKYLERPMLNAAAGIDERLASKIQALSGLGNGS